MGNLLIPSVRAYIVGQKLEIVRVIAAFNISLEALGGVPGGAGSAKYIEN